MRNSVLTGAQLTKNWLTVISRSRSSYLGCCLLCECLYAQVCSRRTQPTTNFQLFLRLPSFLMEHTNRTYNKGHNKNLRLTILDDLLIAIMIMKISLFTRSKSHWDTTDNSRTPCTNQFTYKHHDHSALIHFIRRIHPCGSMQKPPLSPYPSQLQGWILSRISKISMQNGNPPPCKYVIH